MHEDPNWFIIPERKSGLEQVEPSAFDADKYSQVGNPLASKILVLCAPPPQTSTSTGGPISQLSSYPSKFPSLVCNPQSSSPHAHVKDDADKMDSVSLFPSIHNTIESVQTKRTKDSKAKKVKDPIPVTKISDKNYTQVDLSYMNALTY